MATRMERKMTEIANAVKKHRPMLRNANINYSRGTFFVTMQAAFNKTIFGAIVGEKCVLNELGGAVEESLKSLGERYDGVKIDEEDVSSIILDIYYKDAVDYAQSAYGALLIYDNEADWFDYKLTAADKEALKNFD